jgi:hypothetical protein
MYTATALNDVVLNRAGRGGMIEVRVEIHATCRRTNRRHPNGLHRLCLIVCRPDFAP